MKIIFCEDPLNHKQPDDMYQPEAEAAKLAGFDVELINFEALVYDKNPSYATRRISPTPSLTSAIYRGWMLKPIDYRYLFQHLYRKGIQLINDPIAYQHCHYLPDSYDIIKHNTPKTVWLPIQDNVDFEAIMALLTPFGSSSIIVKDYVKSRKHYWEEACFIPDASNQEQVARVVNRFLELQDEDLNVGLVFREFVDLESLTTHSKSGMPLTKEFRVFVFKHQPLVVSAYWEEGNYQGVMPNLSDFQDVMKQITSQFFTMDIAKKTNDEWIIMELGDGQVAGLPETIDYPKFYEKLAIMTS